MERERLIEFLIGICFLIFLVLIVVLVLNFGQAKDNENSKSTEKESQTIINNYYENHYHYPKNSLTKNVVYKSPNYNYVVYKKNYDSWEYWDYDKKKDYLEWKEKQEKAKKTKRHYDDFSSSGIRKKTKSFTSYVDEYSVYVKNEDPFAKYFKVVFLFEDHSESDDFDETETMVKYIRPGETKKFVFRDVHFERNHYDYWDYRVYNQDDGFEQGF